MRLNLKREPEWLELLPGVRVKCAPATSAVFAAARSDPFMEGVVSELPDDLDPTDEAAVKAWLEETEDKVSKEANAVAFGKAIAVKVIEAWEGVEGPDGEPVEPCREYIDAFLDDFRIYDAWKTRYMAKWLGLVDEKNGSAPPPNGSSAAGAPTAKTARKPAKRARSKKTGR